MRISPLFFALFLFTQATFAQPAVVDSLWRGYRQAADDSTRWVFLVELTGKYYRSDLDSAKLLGERSLELARKLKNPNLIANSLSTLGAVFWYRGDLDEALARYFESLDLSEKIDHQKLASTTIGNIGLIYAEQKDFPRALDYLERSLEIKRTLGDSLGMARALTNIGLNHFNAGQLAPARTRFEEALVLAEALGEIFGQGLLLANLGSVCIEEDKPAEGRAYLLRALDIRRRLGDKGGLASTLNTLGESFLREGRPAEALPFLREALDLAQELGGLPVLAANYASLAQAYQSLGDYRTAYDYQSRLLETRDSLNQQEATERIAEMEVKYQSERKDAQLAQQQLELERQTNLRSRLLIGAIAALLLLTALFQYLRYRQRLRRREAELALRLQRAEAEKLRELDQLKSNFFANISHEFRTPLTLIQGPLSDMAEGRFAGDPGNYYRIMLRNCRRLLHLVDQLLDLSRLEGRQMTLHPEPGDLGRFISGLARSFDSLAERRQIDFRIVVAPAVGAARFDPDKLEKVLSNLLTNAFKFTPEQGRVTLRAERQEAQVRILVQDTGIGIPAAHLPHIFDRFYQADHPSAAPGAGIGLALTRELVELLGGHIRVESIEERGTTFGVILPVEWSPDGPAGGQVQDGAGFPAPEPDREGRGAGAFPAPPAPADDRELVLIVEDHEEVRQYLADQLADRYTLLEAVDGEQGLALATEQVPDLIITDIRMPRMDGRELCRRLRDQPTTSHIPIVMLTARADRENKLEGLETGADDYLVKPFDARELRLRMGNLLEQRRRWRERFSREVRFRPSQVAVTSAEEAFLQRVAATIEQQMDDETFGVPQLSEAVGLSRSQLHRKLKAVAGKAPSEIIRDMRLQRAKDLLEKGAGNASEVAFSVGFNSLAYFSKCFKDAFGYPPSTPPGK